MQINIKATNLELRPEIRADIEERIGALEKFLQHIDPGVIELWVEVGKPSRHHQTGKVFYAEANLRLPGKILRAEEFSDDLTTAIDRVREELARQIKKYKGKKIAETRKPLEQ